MSREIKFRAWDEKYKQFADYEDIEECLSCQNRDGWKSSDGMGCCFGINAVEILADCIIEQYTGLKDKNGKEIYEGDIVKARWYRAKHARLDTKGEVKFDDGWFYIYDDPDGQDRLGVPVHNCYDLEVIGNIHENPELSEVE